MPLFNSSFTDINKRDFNILSIHNKIINLFQQELYNVDAYKDEANRLLFIYNNGNKKDSYIAHHKYKNIVRKIDDIESHKYFNDYFEKSFELLEEYKKYKPKSNIFGIKRIKKDKNSILREKICLNYLNVAKKYIHINILYKKRFKCPNCKNIISIYDERCSNSLCNHKLILYKDMIYNSKYSKSTSGSDYTCLGNFKEISSRYQGKWKKKPPEQIITGLRTHLLSINVDPSTIKKTTLHTEMEKIRKISNFKLSHFYYDINYIHYRLTGIPCPDLTPYINKVIKRYEIYEPYYNKYKPPDRKNAFNAHYNLRLFLKKEGYKENKNDYFFKLDTIEVKNKHNYYTELIFNKIQKDRPNEDWKFIYI